MLFYFSNSQNVRSPEKKQKKHELMQYNIYAHDPHLSTQAKEKSVWFPLPDRPLTFQPNFVHPNTF